MIRTIILAALCLSLNAAESTPLVLREADQRIAEAEKAANDVYLKWALALDLTPIPVPTVDADARPSENRAAQAVVAVNYCMSTVRGALRRVDKAKENSLADKDDAVTGVREAVRSLLRVWPDYAAAKNK